MASTKQQRAAARIRRERVLGPEAEVRRSTMQAPTLAPKRWARFIKSTVKKCSVMDGRGQRDCPIQFTWHDGKPALRYCKASGQDGRLIPVEDGIDAMHKAQEACAAWRQKGAAAFDSAPLERYQLGRVRPRRQR